MQDSNKKIISDLQDDLTKVVKEYEEECRKILKDLPEGIEYCFSNRYIIPETGTGGMALTKTEIELAFDPFFEDQQSLFRDLRATVFHELYHVAQGWTGDEAFSPEARLTPLHNALLEGAATVFEREYAGSNPLWGQYDKDSIEDLFNLLKEVTVDDFHENWQKYKFYWPEKDIRWLSYKVGVWIIDEVLRLNPGLDIIDLLKLDPEEILKLSERY